MTGIKAWLGRVPPLGQALMLAMVLLSGSLIFHACANRYEFANLNPQQISKRDRLTGRIELCTRQRGGGMDCTVATAR